MKAINKRNRGAVANRDTEKDIPSTWTSQKFADIRFAPGARWSPSYSHWTNANPVVAKPAPLLPVAMNKSKARRKKCKQNKAEGKT